jgi:hypothetical protein
MAGEQPSHGLNNIFWNPPPSSKQKIRKSLDHVLEYALTYLCIKDVQALKLVSKNIAEVAKMHCPAHLSLSKLSASSMNSATCIRVLLEYGSTLHSLSLSRLATLDEYAIAALLRLCPNLKKLAISDLDWNWNDIATADAIASLPLQEYVMIDTIVVF